MQMLTEALEVLEAGNEALQKENKLLRNSKQPAGGSGTPTIVPQSGRPLKPTSSVYSLVTPMATPQTGSASTMWDNILQQGVSIPSTGSNNNLAALADRNTPQSNEALRVTTQLLGEWRQLALGRLAGSLRPLPLVPGLLSAEEAAKNESDHSAEISAKLTGRAAVASRVYR
jgi:hypothetical protein